MWQGGVQAKRYLEVKIPTVSMRQEQTLAIIGQGYVGLPLAMAAVDAGWTVIGVDSFEAKVAQINSGSSPVEDISNAQLKAAISKGFYTNAGNGIKNTSIQVNVQKNNVNVETFLFSHQHE